MCEMIRSMLTCSPHPDCGQRILLSRGADPQMVLLNKDYEQDLSRILDWGVQITSISTDDGEPVANWEVRFFVQCVIQSNDCISAM